MPKIRYGVAMSLDGFIAGPQGQHDWITMDPELDFAAIWAQFDTLLMGRRTYEVARTRLGGAMQTKRVIVASRTLRPEDHPEITVVPNVTPEALNQLRATSTSDIWLMGGGDLFRTVLNLGQIDQLDITVIPVLLGAGTPVAPHIAERTRLKLLEHRVYPNSGLLTLSYAVL